MIKEIAFTAYPCKNVAKTREWYESHLGLKFTGEYTENGVEMYNEAQVGSGWFSLMSDQWGGRPAGSGGGCAFEVEDIDKTLADLKAKGVAVEEPYPTPVCKVTTISDPEGNLVTLHQRTAPY